ncbi:hypothetical protein [Corynebacterium auriscanis]|uniref:Uncharacterized protein n=1 Tax=Corynebacterium auriscanis TaxID=99807 RepID=A0A0A2DMK5_9CORY|nr:hypothetical protein [Corynebacterium auriscanis]KGM18131.1 hypothetical protein MA47_09505 [Corynebacterium auriscanis]WJY73194.1 hypothetical protein CAURIC_07895 [Corynebacterium auriscanis]
MTHHTSLQALQVLADAYTNNPSQYFALLRTEIPKLSPTALTELVHLAVITIATTRPTNPQD